MQCLDFNKIVVSFLKGPCLEYLLQHKILDTLHTLGRADVGILLISSLPVRCSRFLFYFVILTRHFRYGKQRIVRNRDQIAANIFVSVPTWNETASIAVFC